ncbi:MAG TPA: hypothetical protein VMU08_13175 [Rhizomicrobium sp.]|nr:hypothetical protein [Rhizomicrobium sp.]
MDQGFVEPRLHCRDDRPAPFLPGGATLVGAGAADIGLGTVEFGDLLQGLGGDWRGW